MTTLALLAESYRQKYDWSANDIRAGLTSVAKNLLNKHGTALVDAIAVSIALEALLDHQDVQLDALSESAKEAFSAAFPNVPIDSLNTASDQQIEGMLNAWKGKLFEVDIRDRLNDGEWVGDWHLEPGQTAHLAESATQPGWDLSIHNDDGTIADVIQLKATTSASYIQAAHEHYPDIPIIGTNDVAHHFSGTSDISFSSLSEQDYSDHISEAVLIDSTAEHAADSVGLLLPGSVIAITEIYDVLIGKKTVDQALQGAGERVSLSIAAGIVGAAATVLTGGLLGAIAAVGARFYLGSRLSEKKQAAKSRPLRLAEPYIECSAKRVDNETGHSNPEFKNSPSRYRFRDLENLNCRLALEYSPEAEPEIKTSAEDHQGSKAFESLSRSTSIPPKLNETSQKGTEKTYTGRSEILHFLNSCDNPRSLIGKTIKHKDGRTGKIKSVFFHGQAFKLVDIDFDGKTESFGAAGVKNGLFLSLTMNSVG